MLSTCPPRVTGVALVVSSCPTTRYCWCCSVRLLLLDGPVLLALLWSSQAVDDQELLVLLVLRWSSQAVDDQLLLQRCFLLLQRFFPLEKQLQLL